MDKSSESSSDSDSNSSTSWVFVDDNTVSQQKAANMFHLDCSREPIQELTEQDLLSASSDIESDTDGISVISESEIPTEDLCTNIQSPNCSNDSFTSAETYMVRDNADIETSNIILTPKETEKLPKFFKCQHVLGIGFVLVAVFVASCSRFMTKINLKNVDEFNGVNDVSYDKIDVTHDDLIKWHGEKNTVDEELEQIVDITMSCTYGNKPRNDVKEKEIKKCVKNHYKSKRTCIKRKPQTSDDLQWIEMNNNNADMLKESANDFEPIVHYDSFDNLKQKNSRNKQKDIRNKNKDGTICNTQTEDHTHYKFKNIQEAEKFEKNDNRKHNGKDLKYTKKKYNSQEKLKGDNRQRNIRFQNPEQFRKSYIPLQKSHKQEKDTRQYGYEQKRHNFVDEKKTKFGQNKNVNKGQENPKILNVNDKDKIYKYKDNVANKSEKFGDKDLRDKYRSKVNLKGEQFLMKKHNNGTNGEWYINLHKARNRIRKQEHVSDWVFDRAHIRNKKRNKAQWYFKWMNVREQLRYKQSYRPYSS